MERKLNGSNRQPSRLALQLADAFAPCAHWSEVRVQRGTGGRRTHVIVAGDGVNPPTAAAAPFDWAAGAL
jgi:hypothetical protein